MSLDIDVIQSIKKQKQSFAEAFPNISFQEEKWGFYFEWENSDHYLTNFAMIMQNPDDKTNEIVKWQKKDRERKIVVFNELDVFFPHLEKKYDLGIFFRTYEKLSTPLLTNTGVKFQSYRTPNKDMNLHDSMQVLTEIENIPESKRIEFQRLIGGQMHLFEGVIWTLDKDGSVLSAALTSESTDLTDTKFLDVLSTREKVRQQGHATALLQSILAFNKNKNFITLVKKTKANEKLLESFNFTEFMNFKVYS